MITYPKRGSGQFYEKMVDRIRALGQRVLFNRQVVRTQHDNNRIQKVIIERTDGGEQEAIPCHGQLVSTMPIPLLVKALSPELVS